MCFPQNFPYYQRDLDNLGLDSTRGTGGSFKIFNVLILRVVVVNVVKYDCLNILHKVYDWQTNGIWQNVDLFSSKAMPTLATYVNLSIIFLEW